MQLLIVSVRLKHSMTPTADRSAAKDEVKTKLGGALPAVAYPHVRCDAIFATRDDGALQFRPPRQRG